MELNNMDNKKSVSVYYFSKLKKMKFEKFEIYLGFDKHTQYHVNDYSKEIYKKTVEINDYEKLGLIDNRTFDIKEILVDSKWESLEQLIQKKSNSLELFIEIKKLMRNYLEESLYWNEKGSFELVDFSIIYLIDGEKKEVIDYNEKRRKILVNILVYSSVFFIVSGFILIFINEISGIMVMLIPLMYYLIYVSYDGLRDLRKMLKHKSEGKNLFLFYLIELPYKIVLYSFYLFIFSGWFIIPFYFFYKSSFYFLLLEFIGGVVGEGLWIILYLFVMSYFGKKLFGFFDLIEKKIKSMF
jgi:hypothetical protein